MIKIPANITLHYDVQRYGFLISNIKNPLINSFISCPSYFSYHTRLKRSGEVEIQFFIIKEKQNCQQIAIEFNKFLDIFRLDVKAISGGYTH